MKFTEPFSIASGARLVWMLTATIFFGVGLGVVWWPTSQTITMVKEQAKVLYDEANQNEADIRRVAQLNAVAARVADDVRRLSGQVSQSATTAAALALLNRVSHAYHIDVRSIVPASTALPTPTPLATTRAARSLEGIPVEIDVRGRFRDILGFVSELPRHDVLMEVNDIDLTERGDHSTKPVLGASIHATMFRYLGTVEKETQRASSAL